MLRLKDQAETTFVDGPEESVKQHCHWEAAGPSKGSLNLHSSEMSDALMIFWLLTTSTKPATSSNYAHRSRFSTKESLRVRLSISKTETK
jgi:hypothetical protein